MKGKVKPKVVTSGRLTGAARATQVTVKPAAASRPEPAYSLYSTDSEDQVTTLHKGLDRCAALLGGILQAEKAASPSVPRTVKVGAAKSRRSASFGGKSIKKVPPKTAQKSSQSGRRGPGAASPRTHHSTPPAAHSGVKLHPPKKQAHKLLLSPPALVQTLQHLSHSVPPPRTSTPPLQPSASILLSVHQSSSPLDQLPPRQAAAPHSQAEADGEEEFVPVRDVSMKKTSTDSNTNTCAVEMSNLQLEPGKDGKVTQESNDEEKAKTVQYLLRELKALIAGQGSVAERLLSHLEQTVSSPQMNVGSLNIQQTESEPDLPSLLSQNTQLRRRVRILNQQLKEREKAERRQNLEVLCDSQVLSLQEELITAQSRLREVQDDLTELRKALQDTQSQLRDREAENALMKTDLEATRSRLLDSEREKSELVSLAQQRLEEIGNLNRLLQSQSSSDCPTLVDSSLSETRQHFKHKQDPPVPPTDRITEYLMSLGHVAAEKEENTRSHPDVRPQQSPEVQSCGQRLEKQRMQLSQCDAESVLSDWSMKSGSTFDTRDEAAFRDGLAALDASIASLQKTIQLDMRR
ncbi:bicaudal D-related protein 2 [Stegastes partitus]|uniref:Bicaudal D-related protein 2 n=1 Tax=Stegastes partitus TaxID=144197 RepID=A0A9Y4MWD9_9TELE|nr:PREDICTED: coiled-coil domain-containing protein 14 [Stegastes partitus]